VRGGCVLGLRPRLFRVYLYCQRAALAPLQPRLEPLAYTRSNFSSTSALLSTV
jgi:hypothetical protein